MLHKVALFLWPKFNQLRMMSSEQSADVHAHVRTLLLPMEENAAVDRVRDSDVPPAKKTAFAEWENQDVDLQQDADEVTLYMSHRHVMNDERDLVGWWRTNSMVYPKLAKLARSVLCVPASSSSSERVFSAAGQTLEQRRTALKPSTVDAILFLHDT